MICPCPARGVRECACPRGCGAGAHRRIRGGRDVGDQRFNRGRGERCPASTRRLQLSSRVSPRLLGVDSADAGAFRPPPVLPGALSIAPNVDLTVVDERGLWPRPTPVRRSSRAQNMLDRAGARRPPDRSGAPRSRRPARDRRGDRGVADRRRAGRGRSGAPREAAAFWAADGLTPRRVAERLATATVAVEVIGEADGSEVVQALHDAGVDWPTTASSQLVLTDDYLREELFECNQRALETGRPWMLASVGGVEAWLGPVFVPDRGACWECLEQRLSLHRPLDPHLRHPEGPESAPPIRGRGALPSTDRAVAGMIATAVMRWIVLEGASGLSESMLSVDTRLWQTRSHTLAWRPQCPACGEPRPPETAAARPLDLAPPGKRLAPAGTLRTVTPDATLERFGDQVSPITGAVNRVVRRPSAHPPLHAYMAGPPEAKKHGDDHSWLPQPMTVPGGKGSTDEQARASALCEALERYSGRFGGEEPRLTATFEELGDRAVHPNALMNFSDRQYATAGGDQRAAQSLRTFVPKPFDDAVRCRVDAAVVAHRGATSGCCRPRSATTRPKSRASKPVWPTPTATPPGTRSRRRSCRGSSSSSSATTWRCGGTTGCGCPGSTSTASTIPGCSWSGLGSPSRIGSCGRSTSPPTSASRSWSRSRRRPASAMALCHSDSAPTSTSVSRLQRAAAELVQLSVGVASGGTGARRRRAAAGEGRRLPAAGPRCSGAHRGRLDDRPPRAISARRRLSAEPSSRPAVWR